MNLIYFLPFIILKFTSINCLRINELKIVNFFNHYSSKQSKDKDFLDVDVSSDILTSNIAIYDASSETSSNVNKYNFNSKDGNPYTCWIESDSPASEQESGQHDEVLKQIVLNRRKSCYYFKGKSWIYEYCHLKSARQVSRTKVNDNHEEFSLGRFYPPKRGITFHRKLDNLSTEFFDGTYCALTGSPRTSRIRFICANDKQGMHVTNVMETSACVYNFVVHVPELCDHLPIHGKIKKHKSKIICSGYTSKRSKPEKPASSKSAGKLDELDKILGLVESTYKDSAVLEKYKNLLLKASENLKSQKLEKDFSKGESDVSFLEIFNRLTRPESEPVPEETEDKSKENQE